MDCLITKELKILITFFFYAVLLSTGLPLVLRGLSSFSFQLASSCLSCQEEMGLESLHEVISFYLDSHHLRQGSCDLSLGQKWQPHFILIPFSAPQSEGSFQYTEMATPFSWLSISLRMKPRYLRRHRILHKLTPLIWSVFCLIPPDL